MSEKTEQPTAKRRREALESGQLPRSRLAGASLATLGGLLGAGMGARNGLVCLRGLAVHTLGLQPLAVRAAVIEAVGVMASFCAPALAGAFLGAALGTIAASGVHFDPSQLKPKPERLDLGKNLAQLFSGARLGEVGRGLLVLGMVLLVAGLAAWDGLGELLRLTRATPTTAAALALEWARALGIRAAIVLGLAGLADLALARRRHLKGLMMTREEVKQEHKQSEGDPRHKAKRKALHRALGQGGPARGLQKATAVVVNPTHIAVALRYDESECEAPYLVAKAREADALALRRQAKALGIPVIKDIPLARSLIHFDLGEEIPEELYRAAAAVLKAALESNAEDAGPRSRTA